MWRKKIWPRVTCPRSMHRWNAVEVRGHVFSYYLHKEIYMYMYMYIYMYGVGIYIIIYLPLFCLLVLSEFPDAIVYES